MTPKVFEQPSFQAANSYHGFPMDNVTTWTSVLGYLIPVYYDKLNPGDKVKINSYFKTTTKELTAPAMVDIHERIDWYAVPIDQLYKLFGSKFYGIQDLSSDFYSVPGPYQYSDALPYVDLSELYTWANTLGLNRSYSTEGVSDSPTYQEFVRLADAFNLPHTLWDFNASSDAPVTMSIHPFFFAAYQKVWMDHFRLTDRDINIPSSYNFDSYTGFNNASTKIPSTRFPLLFRLRRRPYKKDYFTSNSISPLQSSTDTGSLGNDLGAVQQWLSGLNQVRGASPTSNGLAPDGGIVTASTGLNTTVRLNTANNGTAVTNNTMHYVMGILNPSNIRAMYAVEKLLEVTRRAKKHYDMQTLAHFGVKVPTGISGESIYIGSQEQDININRVVSSASTSQGSLGELAGYGFSPAAKERKPLYFEANCHCILLGIYSAEPTLSYPNQGLDKVHTDVNASEWYKSEFDKLGMQPLFSYEADYGDGTNSFVSTSRSAIIGWQARYMQQKAKYNRSFGGVTTTYFQEWILNRNLSNLAANALYLSNSAWYYVSPADMNDLLIVPYPTTFTEKKADSVYAFDYLVSQAYFDIAKSSKMSEFGVPNL